MTICPAASTTRPAPTPARLPGAPIAAIRPPAMPISAGRGPEGRTARPPETIMSSISASFKKREPGAFVDRQNTDPEIVDLYRAGRGQTHLEPGIEVERHSESKQQRSTDHVAVADDDDGSVAVRLMQFAQCLDRSFLDLPHALAAGHGGDAAAGAPQPPPLVGSHRVKTQPSPLAEIELEDVVTVFDR